MAVHCKDTNLTDQSACAHESRECRSGIRPMRRQRHEIRNKRTNISNNTEESADIDSYSSTADPAFRHSISLCAATRAAIARPMPRVPQRTPRRDIGTECVRKTGRPRATTIHLMVFSRSL